MNRRDFLTSIAVAVAAVNVPACGQRTAVWDAATDEDVRELLRVTKGIHLTQAEVADVRQMIRDMRLRGDVGPQVQPCLMFDPEVDLD